MAILTFVGSGQMASALTYPVVENGHEVRLVGTHLDREIIDELKSSNFHKNLNRTLHDTVKYYQIEEVKEALAGAEVVLCGVSSFGVDWFLEEIIPLVPLTTPIIAVTKGLINCGDGTMISYPQYWESKMEDENKRSIYGIGGPCTSYELADKDHSAVAFCGPDMEILRKLKSYFSAPYYHVSLSTDVVGVECAVALKNAYALAVTLAVGLSEARDGIGIQHYNSQAALFGQSVKEMTRLLQMVGGGAENMVYGAGDLYVTVFGGRTRRIGTLLGRGMSFDEAMKELAGVTLESIVIASRMAQCIRTLVTRGEVEASNFPLLLHIDDIINNNAPVDIPWKAFEEEVIS